MADRTHKERQAEGAPLAREQLRSVQVSGELADQFGGAGELVLRVAETVPDVGASNFNAESATGAFITG